MSISMARGTGDRTLTEAARLLKEPQHRLIYLCEKGVVEPDVQDAAAPRGTGSPINRIATSDSSVQYVAKPRLVRVRLP